MGFSCVAILGATWLLGRHDYVGDKHLKESENESHSVVSDSLQPRRRYSPWNSPGQNTGVHTLSFLQGVFPTQGSNPGCLHAGKSSLDYLKLSLKPLDSKCL